MTASNDGIPDSIAAEFGEKAREVVRQGLDELAHITTDLGKAVEAFNRQQKETRERIDRGPRRTDGRIV